MVSLNNVHGAAVTSVVRDGADSTLARIRIEPFADLAHVNRLRPSSEPVTSLEDLLGSSPPRRMVVDFDGGLEAAVVDVVEWGASQGHHGAWLRLVPSAVPSSLLPT